MIHNALLYVDTVYLDEIKTILQDEEFKVFDLFKQDNILKEISKGYLDVVFISCSCNSCESSMVPTVKKIKKLDPRVDIVCVGTREDENKAVEIIKCGATACLGIPIDKTAIKKIIKRIRESDRRRKEIFRIEKALHEKYIFHGMVSKTPAMLDIFSLIQRVAPYYRTMLITGDTGTGKEALARAMHELGPGREQPFIACNCSGLVEHLIESELFGHVKGAFTGAISDKKGLFEAAGSGTIFLDEIGHMPLSFQPHLLRVLQNGEFRRVGSTDAKKAQCRVIAAANVDLNEKIKQGLFREDLFYRLSTVIIDLPPLRDRKEDIQLLCRFFLDRFREKTGKEIAGISMPTKRLLMAYDWPGNIRELENVLERAVLVTLANFIRPEDLPEHLKKVSTKSSTNLSVDEIIKTHIQNIMIMSGGNKTKAAAILGMSRRALLRKINKFGLS
ncbi:MAG: sigma-54-dependent Fis family transcriptional regulator [Nitrospiraceae bacterium]|nr:MAG: sigma-54-dependent Fis family transcriptional regulator [Nitrospiraceae bacterium]